MDNDMYGRTVTFTNSKGRDYYQVFNPDGSLAISVDWPEGELLETVYKTINSLAPGDWVPPA